MFTHRPTNHDGATVGFHGAALPEEDYGILCRLIYEQSRIHLGTDKRVLVTSRLANWLRSPTAGEELQFLIGRISRRFFREMKHFDFLWNTVIPQWREQDRLTEK
jgi:chemotaxis protein methyltransferase CheR